MNEKPKRRGRPRKVRPELQVRQAPTETSSPRELEEYIQEANEVNQLTSMRGWHILKRDLMGYRESLMSKLAYMNVNRPEFDEMRRLYIASDKLISMVEDYKVNRDKAKEYLNVLNNPEIAVALDVDNEI